MPARQVDEVRLADRLERGRVVALARRRARAPARPRRPSAAKCSTPISAQARNVSSPSGADAVGRIDDARPRTAGGREQASVELGHGCEELTGADERHGSGHGAQHRAGTTPSPATARTPRRDPVDAAPRPLRHSPHMQADRRDQGPALDHARRDPRLGHGVPRRHRHEPRPAARSAGSCRADRRLDARGPDVRRLRLPRDPRRAARPRRRPRRLLRPAADLRHRAHRLRHHVASCAASRRPSSCWSSPGSSRARPARCSSRARSRSSPRLFEGPARARAFGIWASATSATALSGRSSAACSSTRVELAGGVPDQRAAGRRSPCSRRSATCPRRKAEDATGQVRLARRARRGRRRRRARVRGDPRPGAATGRTRSRGSSLAIGAIALDRVPDPHGPPPEPARAARPVPAPAVRDDQPLDAADLRRAVHDRSIPGPVPAERRRLHGDRGRAHRPADRHHPDAALGARRDAGGADRARPFLVVGPLIMAAGLLWLSRASRPTTEPWRLALGDPSTCLPPLSTLVDILPYVLLFGIGISLVVAPLTTTLMSSVPVANAGLASAINNAISRVGQPLLSARDLRAWCRARSTRRCAAVAGRRPERSRAAGQVQPLNPPAARRRRPRSPRRRRRPRSTRCSSPSSCAAPLLAGGARGERDRPAGAAGRGRTRRRRTRRGRASTEAATVG